MNDTDVLKMMALVTLILLLLLPLLYLLIKWIEKGRANRVKQSILSLKNAREIKPNMYGMKVEGLNLILGYQNSFFGYQQPQERYRTTRVFIDIFIEIPPEILRDQYEKIVGRLDVDRLDGELFVFYQHRLPFGLNTKKMMIKVLKLIQEIKALDQ